jgi:hypothetical protein
MPRDTYITSSRQNRDSSADGLHEETFFDEDERRSDGALYDERNGKPYENSTSIDPQLVLRMGHVIDLAADVQGPSEDVMGSVEEDDDFTAQWLKEHEAVAVPESKKSLDNVA